MNCDSALIDPIWCWYDKAQKPKGKDAATISEIVPAIHVMLEVTEAGCSLTPPVPLRYRDRLEAWVSGASSTRLNNGVGETQCGAKHPGVEG
ncbi:MAG: hypothetical protein Q8K12_10080 [Thiobacillus sp.]|nr:hypothetical protein [Thiobacillus sp.]